MSIQEVGRKGKEGIREYTGSRKQKYTEGFQESLIQNLKYREQEQASLEPERVGRKYADAEAMRTGGGDSPTELKSGRNADRANVSMGGNAARIRMSVLLNQEAVQTAEVRHMSYEESDHIEIAVVEGYTLKGKLDGHQVYVEAKYEDGRLEAYRVDPAKVQKQTQQRIEQFALETAESI